MKLIDDAGKLWHRLWSVRLSLLAAFGSAIEAAWMVYTTGQPPIIAIITLVISLGAAFSRMVAQPKTIGGQQ